MPTETGPTLASLHDVGVGKYILIIEIVKYLLAISPTYATADCVGCVVLLSKISEFYVKVLIITSTMPK